MKQYAVKRIFKGYLSLLSDSDTDKLFKNVLGSDHMWYRKWNRFCWSGTKEEAKKLAEQYGGKVVRV